MKLGAVFPTTEIGDDPSAIRDWAQTAEELGYHHILTYDHVVGAVHEGRKPKLMGPYTEADPFHEPLVLLGYLAALTRRVELVPGILILPQRQTVLVAKQVAEVDVLSGGRMRLGLGTGWNHVEYESLGVPYEDRGKRFDEQVELLRQLWTQPVVDFRGEYHRVDRAGILPRPSRSIPICFGGFTEVAVKRAVRLGDGFIFAAEPTTMRFLNEQLEQLLKEEGRLHEGFIKEALVDFSAGPEVWARECEFWTERGGTHLTLRAMDTAATFSGGRIVGYEGPQAYIDALESFATSLR